VANQVVPHPEAKEVSLAEVWQEIGPTADA